MISEGNGILATAAAAAASSSMGARIEALVLGVTLRSGKEMENQTTGVSFPAVEGNSSSSSSSSSTSLAWVFLSLGVIPVWILSGNVLVLLAVLCNRSLRNLSNRVIASLAFTDLLLSMLVVPLGVYQLVRDKR